MNARTDHSHPPRGDFALNTRLLRITAMAAVIGAISTGAARVLLDLIRFFTNLFFFQTFSLAEHSPGANTLGLWVIAVPVVGGLVVGLVARYGSDKIRGHGIPEAIEAILFGKSRMSFKVALLKPLSSGIVIGSGGPFGAEGPIIMTGGAIGSLIAQHFHLTAAERKALLVAGATAGMTAVFGTPVAAVLLAVELLLFELRPRSLLPVAVACAVAGFTRPLLMDAGPLFPLQTAVPGPLAMLSCVVAGVLCGALSASLSLSLYKVEDWFGKLPVHWMWWPAIGGLAVGIGGYFQPRALGVGYDVIGDLLNNHLALGVVAALLAVKALIWVVSLGSGTSGGVLAPLLMMGAGLGAVLSHVLPGNDPTLWPLVCMAATLGGVMRAPLTATVFAFGLTHDSNALLPLLTTSAVAYGFTVLTMRRSILTEKIARRGYHIYREYGVDPLERHSVEEVMTREVRSIDAALPVARALFAYFGEGQAHRAFPVLRNGGVIGMADRVMLAACHARDVHEAGGAGGPLATVGEACADLPLYYALPGENCRTVATRMARHRLERLPVVKDAQSFALAGIVARSDLIKPSLAHFDEEEKRERTRRLPWRSA
ncbi:chloride channel protein [Variovorax sp. J22G73]|uniref:chloride channel protein n=1 Tax=unclassified Variovorax TaxID=663243 RepID=UPI002575E27B|nr:MULTISPECIES: chloride channel protein [unclassified Variovorax]MDM0009373.1 chloride channel protein [Variovorax sp. J22R203]MDM0101880.1 chloride channel protein [Variovorax sp. J22G73]